jgi:hypothetical protein
VPVNLLSSWIRSVRLARQNARYRRLLTLLMRAKRELKKPLISSLRASSTTAQAQMQDCRQQGVPRLSHLNRSNPAAWPDDDDKRALIAFINTTRRYQWRGHHPIG